MNAATDPNLSGVAETLLIPLYIRAMESKRPDALVKDERAEALVRQLDQESLRKTLALTDGFSRVAVILKGREFDRFAQDFMARHPDAVVVHIGCGLDTRFERLDNGRVEWYDLDLPYVIDLRRRLLGGDGERYHLLGCSVLDDAWRPRLLHASGMAPRPILFLAEGVFMYFEEAQVKSLVRTLASHFPGSELVFDGYSPLHVLRSNLQTARYGLRIHWGIWRGREIEKWGAGISLLDEWGFFDDPTPRLDSIRWLRGVEAAARTFRIYHFCLGKE